MPAKLTEKEQARRAFKKASEASVLAQHYAWVAMRKMALAKDQLAKVTFCSEASHIGTFLTAELERLHKQAREAYLAAAKNERQTRNLSEMLGLR